MNKEIRMVLNERSILGIYYLQPPRRIENTSFTD